MFSEGAKGESKSDQPPEAVAATKIQAAFRGHQTRKTMSMKAVQKKEEPEPSKAELEAEFRADDKGKSLDYPWLPSQHNFRSTHH